MTKLTEIETIGPVCAGTLEGAGVKNVEQLLETGASRSGRAKLAQACGMGESRILRWVNMADLMRINGVGEEYSDLLEAAGVDTVKELRTRNAENLFAKIKEVNDAKNLVRQTPTQSSVTSWIDQAKNLEDKISH
ncbi:MAG: DUF4332 domain-containing protein [Myxococcota bacterium]